MARYAPFDLVTSAAQLLISSFQIHSPLSSSHTVQAMDSARSSYEDDAAALKNATGPCVPAHPFCSIWSLIYMHQVQSLTRWLRRRILVNHQVHVRVGAHNVVRVSEMTSAASALEPR